MSSEPGQRAMDAPNVLAKWRTLFAGWQLGTRPKGKPVRLGLVHRAPPGMRPAPGQEPVQPEATPCRQYPRGDPEMMRPFVGVSWTVGRLARLFVSLSPQGVSWGLRGRWRK